MSLPDIQVLIEFTGFDPNIQPFFKLDDAEQGRLGNEDFRLAPVGLLDITPRVRGINFGRGKGARFANFQAGQMQIEFNNHDRAFDPLYEDSPFFGLIQPRREIRVLANNRTIFTGYIEDWDFTYENDGNSLARAKCFDGLYILAGQKVNEFTPTAQKTGERIEEILNKSEVNWPAEDRNLDTGITDLGTQPVSDGTNALTYMQKVTETEPGLLFLSKDGDVTFKDKYKTSTSPVTEFSDEGINFANLEVIFGSELLYNEITIANVGGGTAVATDQDSADEFGFRALSLTNLLGANDTQSADLAVYYASKFSQPSYRFESLEVFVHSLDEAETNQLLDLELGDAATVKFTPNGIGNPIERDVEIIRIEHTVTPDSYIVQFGFQEVSNEFFVLDDPIFGKLDAGVLT